jgi:tetratricopeptide (TPR) repeat protein
MKPTPRYLRASVAVFFAVTAIYATFRPSATATGLAANSGQATPPAPGASSTDIARSDQLTFEDRGDIFMARKDYDHAVEYYQSALKQLPSQNAARNAQLWNKMGIAFQQENKFYSARKAYLNSTRAEKTFAEPWNNVGTVYFLVKRYGKSVGYFQRALKLKSNVAVFHMNLGSAYYHLKHYQEAVQEYRVALTLDPKVINSQSSTGTMIHAGATDVQFYFYMAKALASVGNAESAVRYLRRALEDGYTNRSPLDDDPDFKKISQYPAFVELMRNPPIAIKD